MFQAELRKLVRGSIVPMLIASNGTVSRGGNIASSVEGVTLRSALRSILIGNFLGYVAALLILARTASRAKAIASKLTKQSVRIANATQSVQPLLPVDQSLTSPGAHSFFLAIGDRVDRKSVV